MTADIHLLARDRLTVKTTLMNAFSELVDGLLDRAGEEAADSRSMEVAVWAGGLPIVRMLLAVTWGILCRRTTEADIRARGLPPDRVRLRLERDYWITVTSTAGPVEVPLFAYREQRAVGSVTRVPVKGSALALHRKVRSSELCLEWEARLGSRMPFREAEELLGYMTHGAAHVEDNTINAHMTAVGALIDPRWLYLPPERVREVLRDRAMCDEQTGQPVLYISTDAHALRQLADASWTPSWKMANGIRLWCIDRRNGQVIHIGGEYTWGDCKAVAAAVQRLVASEHLPENGDYGQGVTATLVAVTDGLGWIRDHFLARLPWASQILDAHHAWKHIRDFAAAVWRTGTKAARSFLDRAYRAVFGRHRKARPRQSSPRRGHKKQSAAITHRARVARRRAWKLKNTRGAALLLELLRDVSLDDDASEQRDALLRYVESNADRMDYAEYTRRGWQIGSGAMESLHRTASQIRMKRPGPGWLKETSAAVFNLRMLDIVGRWDEFWNDEARGTLLLSAFGLEANGNS